MTNTDYDYILSQLKGMTEGFPQEALDMELRITAHLLRLLARGKPVTTAQLAEAWAFPLEQVEQLIAGAQGKLEINEDGHIIGGSGLSLQETDFPIHLNTETLYAWCGMDVLFLAGFIGETITAETSDPITGERITLTIDQDKLNSYSPEDLTLSVYLPGEDGAYNKNGANSEVCLNMRFFASRESASQWLVTHPANRLLPVDQAYQLVRDIWLDRLDIIMN